MSLSGRKDVDLLILSRLSDRELFNYCLTDKYAYSLCADESFWMNRFISTFGNEKMKFKSANRTWKNFYLSIISFLGDSADKGMSLAAEKGDKDAIEFFISEGADYWDLGMSGAVRGGHKNLVDFFIEKGADDWEEGRIVALQTDREDLVKFFENKQ